MSMHLGTVERPSESGVLDILATASQSGCFKTLITALQATGMSASLKGEGPFTVFAPTDAAFSNLAAGTLDSLLKPASRERLAWILSCHLVEGRIDFQRLSGLSTVKTVDGELVRVFTAGAEVKVDGALVTHPDVECSNGVIHVVDQVILPGR